MTSCSFATLPDGERMRLRALVEDEGGSVVGYPGVAVQYAMPRGEAGARAREALRGAGLVCVDSHYSALVTDRPPEIQRHRCPGYADFGLHWWLFETWAYPVHVEESKARRARGLA